MSEFVEEEEAKVFVGFEVEDGLRRAEEKFATGFKGEVGVGGLKRVEENEVGAGKE